MVCFEFSKCNTFESTFYMLFELRLCRPFQIMYDYVKDQKSNNVPIQVLIGNREWMNVNGVDVVSGVEDATQNWERQGKTVILVSVDGELNQAFYQHYVYSI